jgi:hypothetical protein
MQRWREEAARMVALRESRMADKPLAWIMTCIMWAGPVWGFSVAPQIDCPTQFRAIASEVSESESSEHALSKTHVTFQIEEAIKGSEIDSQHHVELLKFGPVTIEQGKEYLVQLDQGKLCWIEAI